MTNVLFLMMGGIGFRFGAEIPKQFTIVNEKPVFRYILEAYDRSNLVNTMIVVCNEEWIEHANDCLIDFNTNKKLLIVCGGKTRSESVKKAVESIKNMTDPDDIVMVHDATHPYLDDKAVEEALIMMEKYDGVTICQREYDTCYSIEDSTIISEIPKTNVVSGASPEMFRFKDMVRMYTNTTNEKLESMSSVGAMALSIGLKIGIVPSKLLNIKITLPEDMVLFKELCSTYYFKG